MHIHRRWQIAVVLLAVGCSQSPAPIASNAGRDAADLATRAVQFSEAVVRASASGWQAAEVDALCDFYTLDTVLFPPQGPAIRGREAVRAYWSRTPNQRILRHAITTERSNVDGDLAADHGTFTLTFQAGDTPPQAGTSNFVSVWRRGADGKWRKHLDSWW